MVYHTERASATKGSVAKGADAPARRLREQKKDSALGVREGMAGTGIFLFSSILRGGGPGWEVRKRKPFHGLLAWLEILTGFHQKHLNR